MHKNCFPFPIKLEQVIKEYVRSYFKDLNTDKIYSNGLELPASILDPLNEEMKEYGLPNIANGLAFKRKNYLTPSHASCHIDYSRKTEQKVKASLVIPVDGCKGTAMYWYDGDYTTEIVYPTPEFPYQYPYMKTTWASPGYLVEQVEIADGPMLCRVDIPHSAISRPDGTYRLIMSMRFAENLSIEELYSRRSSMDRTETS